MYIHTDYIHSTALSRLLSPYWQLGTTEAWLPIIPGVLALGISGAFARQVLDPLLAGYSLHDLGHLRWGGLRLVWVWSERRWLRQLVLSQWGALGRHIDGLP